MILVHSLRCQLADIQRCDSGIEISALNRQIESYYRKWIMIEESPCNMPALYHTNKAAFTNRLNTYTQTDMDTHKN